VRVLSADIALCALPLPCPLRVGNTTYLTRDYALVRLTTDEDVVGYAYGYTRGAPLVEAIEVVARSVIGQDPVARRRIVGAFLDDKPALSASVMRGISLVDIALWDAAAKRSALSLSMLLGVQRDRVPAMAVCGYFLDVLGRETILAQLDLLAGSGFSTIKLMLAGSNPTSTIDLVAECVDVANGRARIGVDFHYALRSRSEAISVVRALEDLPLAFIEDPFPAWRWRELRALSASTRTPIAAGEDVLNALAYLDLLDAVSILRVDISTCGGITSALSALELANCAGVGIIPHVFAGLSGQLAGSYDAITMVEVIPSDSGADPIHDLLKFPPVVKHGELVIDTAPGCGVDVDWSAVVARAERIVSL
jgi:L-alanine-DL-glutamate epimerase-like enolase superfamily enzyme